MQAENLPLIAPQLTGATFDVHIYEDFNASQMD
jgi:hypothetical protein